MFVNSCDFAKLFTVDHKQDTLQVLAKITINNKKAVLPQGNRAMPQVFFSVEVRQQHSLQV